MTTRLVSDCQLEAESLRKKAEVYMRLRCCVLTHVKVGNPPREIPNELAVAVAEELLAQANSAAQRAELVLATVVHESDDTARGRRGGCKSELTASRLKQEIIVGHVVHSRVRAM